jgi:hypothetical protein
MGQELVESLIQISQEDRTPLPPPHVFDTQTNFAPNPFKNRALAAQLRPRRALAQARR